MSHYGDHPTIYSNCTDDELFAMYRGSVWFGMDETGRRELLQETVNRAAAAKGEMGSCEVRFVDMDSSTWGKQSGNTIELNRDKLAMDTNIKEYNGHIIEEQIPYSNMEALETVFHEDIHAWENQCIDGTIQCSDPKLLEEYRANNFTVSAVPDENGGVRPGSHYLNGITDKTGYYMYYFQSTERDAHRFSEKQTLAIMNSLKEKYGEEESFAIYEEKIQMMGYEVTYKEGQEIFGNPDFDKEINKVLVNQYNGTNEVVDENILSAVQSEMAASFDYQHMGRVNSVNASQETINSVNIIQGEDNSFGSQISADVSENNGYFTQSDNMTDLSINNLPDTDTGLNVSEWDGGVSPGDDDGGIE